MAWEAVNRVEHVLRNVDIQMTPTISNANATGQQPVAANSIAGGKAEAAKKPDTAKVAAAGDSTAHVAPATKVTISAAGQAAAAATQEAMETPAQTAREAQGSDMQAKRLLAKEQAAALVSGS